MEQVRAKASDGDTAEAHLVAFINTRYDGKGGRIERFGNAGDFATWARENGLLGEESVSESDALAARELRGALLNVLITHGEQAIDPTVVKESESLLARASEMYPVRVVVTANSSTVTGQRSGAAGVFGTVLGAANQIIDRDRWHRIKVCCSAPCQHVFVDKTRNASQRYCDQKCSSRAAMRAMRERQATSS